MKGKGHGLLKRSSDVFKAEGHLPICKHSPMANESSLMLVLVFNMDLIISGKSIHEGEHLATRTLIQNMINKWCEEVVLRIDTIQITEISTYADRSLFLIHRNGV